MSLLHVNLDEYFARIGYDGPRAPTVETLAALHRRHMIAVPFENLDIPLGRHIALSPDALRAKVIGARRGGFCYELNTLFCRLLRSLGFEVDVLSARVRGAKGWGPDKDHMALLVRLGAGAWLADVGFGDSFLSPLRLEAGTPQEAGFTAFRLTEAHGWWTMQARDVDADWKDQYRFTLDAHAAESFQAMCDYQQTSPASSFTGRVVCSRATETGRVTVTHNRLIVTRAGERTETELADAEAFRSALAEHLGVRLAAREAAAVVARFA